MQVVISGGGTPTPSPRVQRKQLGGYGRGLVPGYAQGSSTPKLHHRSSSKDRKESVENDSSLRDSIPAMRRPVAITCLVLNILIPGLGTFVAGLTVLCGSPIRYKDSSSQKVICSNTWVAFLQFATAFLFLLGWIWSIVWGVAFITISNDYYIRFIRPSMQKGRGDSTELKELKEKENGVHPRTVNRTGSSPGLCSGLTTSYLEKPIMLRSSSADQPQPTIILQKAPYVSHSESSLASKKKVIDAAKVKHQKLLMRQVSDNELSSLKSSQERLEQIVIHNLPRAPARRGILRREDTITSTSSDLDHPYS